LNPYDYVIIGAGSAGCVLASELAQAGHRILVLEAGGSDRSPWIRMPIGYGRTYFDKRVNWCYHTATEAGLDNRSSYWPRGKVIGGSSSINAMVYYRGLPGDFDDWARVAGDRWNWRSLRPVFESNERRFHADGSEDGNGPLCVTDPGSRYHRLGNHYLQAASELGFESNPLMIEGEGVGRYCITAHRGLRCSAADAFLKPALGRDGLDLLRHAHATRILFDGQRANGVEFRLRDGLHRVYCRHEVIVSGGAVNSPQLLQLSGIGPGKLLSRHGIPLKADLPATGGNLQDHLAITYFYKSRIATLNNQLRPWWGKLWVGLQYLLARRGPLSLGVNQFGGFVRSRPGLTQPDIQLYFNPITYSKVPKGKRPLLSPDPYPGFILSFQPCRPYSRGRIDIRSSNPEEPPDIQPGYLTDHRDLDCVVSGARVIARLCETPALRAVNLGATGPTPETMTDEQVVADFRQRADTVFHPVGTCAMGHDPSNSVVDAELRVHGIDGLRVVDASVFPNVTSGNTNAATLMLARRAASLILERTTESRSGPCF
jgi:choline dehydrogenase